MLKDLFKKNDENKSIILIVGIVVALAVVCFSNGRGEVDKLIKSDADANVTKLLENIKDNYSVAITKDDGLEQHSYNYSTDSNLTVIDEGEYSDKVYLVYDNKKYNMNIDNHKLTKVKDIELLKDNYINIDFIKKIINNCEFEYVNDNNKVCYLSVKDYIDEYNNYFNKEYSSNDEKITINIIYYSKNIKSIIIDYTNVNKIINNSEDNLKYSFVFTDIDKNNYSEIISYYKKDFK